MLYVKVETIFSFENEVGNDDNCKSQKERKRLVLIASVLPWMAPANSRFRS